MMSRKNRVDSKKYAIKGDKLTQLLLIGCVAIISSACTPLGTQQPLLHTSSSSELVAVDQSMLHKCDGCMVEPLIEYVDVVVPECLQPVALVTHRPVCQVCDGYSVSVRSQSGPGKCGEGES